MLSKSINSSSKTIFFSLLIAFFPLSSIAGSLIINLNILIIIISAILIYDKEILSLNFNIIDKLVLIIFLYILFVGLFNTFENYYLIDDRITDLTVLKKTFLFTRYFLIYFVIRFLLEKKIINLKYFFLASLIGCLFVSIDIFYQFIFEKDIFGYEKIGRKYPGPFGDEAIAGGYIQRYSFLAIFYFFLFHKLNNKKYFFLNLVLFIAFLVAIVISGNRMPLILFIFSIFLVFIFEKKLRKYLIFLLVICSFAIISMTKIDPAIKNNFSNFVKQITWSYNYLSLSEEVKKTKTLSPQYLYEFSTAYETWRLNKYIGGGIKSFRVNCIKRDNVIEKWRDWSCNIHPHNYYLEILTELGLVGLFIILFLIIQLLYLSFVKNNYLSSGFKLNNMLTPFILLFVAEIFPIRSSGSFFTTNNSAFIFLLLAIIVTISKDKNLN
jgi:O-antigen ligase